METKIKDILIITKPEDKTNFINLISNGNQWGINVKYKTQQKPNGIAEALLIAKDFIKNQSVCLILGDNIFYGSGFKSLLNFDKKNFKGSKIVSYKVPDPENYGVIIYKNNKIHSIKEKPKKTNSNEIITGLYFYDKDVVKNAIKLKPSPRNELEISDLNNIYLKQNKLEILRMKPGMVWLDLGSSSSLLKASQYVSIVQERQNIQIGCPEEIAYKNNWINTNKLKNLIKNFPNNSYSNYLKSFLIEEQNK